jgi:hypothetical protein
MREAHENPRIGELAVAYLFMEYREPKIIGVVLDSLNTSDTLCW